MFEREGGQAQTATTLCASYQRGEVQRSRTQQGHLPADVIVHPRGLLIADFGVDWRTPKSSVSRDATLRNRVNELIQVVRANPATRITISGYSDCVGRERDNSVLRLGRARRVLQLLQHLAGRNWGVLRTRITVRAAPAGEYVADNATVAGRATNRGVLIESVRDLPFEPDVITPRPDTIERICRRGLELVQQQDQFGIRITVHQQQRIRCFLSRLCQAGFDDRYLTAQGVLDYENRLYSQPYHASAKQWLLPAYAVRAGGLRPDRDIWQTLIRIDDDIIEGRNKIDRFYTHGGATSIRVRELRDWVANREGTRDSIYWCYGKQGP